MSLIGSRSPLAAPGELLTPGRLPELLRHAAQGKTGLLTFTGTDPATPAPRVVRSLRYGAGALLGGASSVASERLGETLVRHGMIPFTALVQATTIVSRDRRRLGEVLLEQGLLDEERLCAGLELQTRDVLRRTIAWTAAAAAFLPGEASDPGHVRPRTATAALVLETARTVADEQALRHAVGSLERRFAPAGGAPLALLPAESTLLRALAGATGQAALRRCGLPEPEAVRALAALLLAGVILPVA